MSEWMTTQTQQGLELLNGTVMHEAMMLGYANDFRAMVVITVAAIPMLLLLKANRPVVPAAA